MRAAWMAARVGAILIVGLAASPVGAAPAHVAAERSADAEVRAAADAAWRRSLEEAPFVRLARGLPVERIDTATPAWRIREMAFARRVLARLDRVDRAGLTPLGQVRYATLRDAFEMKVAADRFYWLEFPLVPYKAAREFGALNQALAATADPTARAKLARLYAGHLDAHRTRLNEQAKRGIRMPKAAVDSTVVMLAGLHDGLPADDLATRAVVAPAYQALIAELGDGYRTKAPEALGLFQYPQGRAYYRHLIREFTGLDLTAADVHQRGLDWVADLDARIAAKKAEVGFSGSNAEFLASLRADPRFKAASAAEAEALYRRYMADIRPLIPRCFQNLPDTPYDVQRAPPATEKGMTYGYYAMPTAAEPRGLYFYNGADFSRGFLPERARVYHELVPGHHFQVAVQKARSANEPYFANAFHGAFTEGWAEYAASLGYEMGLYADPYDDVGRLTQEMFIAVRLVVDTGLGDLGWTREQAEAYMRAHVYQTDAEIRSEVLRYATMPGQAIGYGVGFQTFWAERRRAEAALGDRFDIRAFHEAVIGGGSVPLNVLKTEIDQYIATAFAAPAPVGAPRSCRPS